ncbi:hypothetical protein H4I96_04004 [Botrytis cinerea]
MGINFNWQEMNVLAPAPTEQGFISGEVDANTVLIGQQATPSAPVIGPFANHVAPAPRFACDSIGCGKTFGRQSDCNRHMKKHGLQSILAQHSDVARNFIVAINWWIMLDVFTSYSCNSVRFFFCGVIATNMSQIARFLEGIFSLLFLSIDIACFSVWINVVEHVDFGEGECD